MIKNITAEEFQQEKYVLVMSCPPPSPWGSGDLCVVVIVSGWRISLCTAHVISRGSSYYICKCLKFTGSPFSCFCVFLLINKRKLTIYILAAMKPEAVPVCDILFLPVSPAHTGLWLFRAVLPLPRSSTGGAHLHSQQKAGCRFAYKSRLDFFHIPWSVSSCDVLWWSSLNYTFTKEKHPLFHFVFKFKVLISRSKWFHADFHSNTHKWKLKDAIAVNKKAMW